MSALPGLVLMNLHGQEICARNQIAWVDHCLGEFTFGRAIHRILGQSRVSYRAARHIGPEDFRTVEINNGAIVSQDSKNQDSGTLRGRRH